VKNLARGINPNQRTSLEETDGKQTIELRSPDGSAIIHLLLAGIAMAAEWGFAHEESLEIAKRHYVSGNVFKDEKLLGRLPALSKSCVGSAEVLLEKRDLYEREGIFPPSAIEYVVKLLQAEHDSKMNQRLADLPADDRLLETRRIMHKDLHRH
jgi:glutamine synthetase